MISKCSMYGKSKERGLGKNKHKWIIDKNKVRKIYLNMYLKIYCIDHLIYNEKILYRNRKYWYSPITCEKALDVIVA